MRKKKKKKARMQSGEHALITAQTATNLLLNEEILKIKAEIARTKLEMMKLNLPAPKGKEVKCYYYKSKSPNHPIIIIVDTQSSDTLSDLQKFITTEFLSVDSKLFPSRLTASLSQAKTNFKTMLKGTGNQLSGHGVSALLPYEGSASLSTIPSHSELSVDDTQTEELLVTSHSSPLSPMISTPTTPSLLPFNIPIPSKIEIHSNSNNSKEKAAKKLVDWKFKDKEGDFVSITKRNTILHIISHAQSIHIFEKRLDDD